MTDLSQEGTDGLEQESDDVDQLLQTTALVLISISLLGQIQNDSVNCRALSI